MQSPTATPVQAPSAPRACMPPLPPLPPSDPPANAPSEPTNAFSTSQTPCLHPAHAHGGEQAQTGSCFANASAGWCSSHAPPVDVPLITQMLLQEADAWRALLSLHGSILNLTRALSLTTAHETAAAVMEYDEQQQASDQRQATYLASVSQLTAQCDLLITEAVKIRGLRKAKHQAETHAFREVLRLHSDEALAIGDTLARNSALNLAVATSELRQAAQATRAQIQQARALAAAVADVRSNGRIPKGAAIVMGVRQSDGELLCEFPVATLLERVYARGSLTDETLCAALLENGVDAPAHSEKRSDADRPPRTFARRACDRAAPPDAVSTASAANQ